jgi:hypothetical protein
VGYGGDSISGGGRREGMEFLPLPLFEEEQNQERSQSSETVTRVELNDHGQSRTRTYHLPYGVKAEVTVHLFFPLFQPFNYKHLSFLLFQPFNYKLIATILDT